HQDYVEKAKLSPARIFKFPMDVVETNKIGPSEKLAILQAWEADEQALLRAEDEGMGGGEHAHLHKVQAALNHLRGVNQATKTHLRNVSMSDLIVYGFPRSTFVNIVRLVVKHKDVSYTFHDLEREMGKPSHLALHPFNRVPILRHGDFTVYETSAIVSYLEEIFPTPALQPKSVRDRARMNQWISTVNSYYYPYMIYHVSHERNVFPELGIPSDENVVAHALPKIEVGLKVAERELAHGKDYLLGSELTLADFYLLPSTYSFSFAPEAKAMYPKYPGFSRWREKMEGLPTVKKLRGRTTAA